MFKLGVELVRTEISSAPLIRVWRRNFGVVLVAICRHWLGTRMCDAHASDIDDIWKAAPWNERRLGHFHVLRSCTSARESAKVPPRTRTQSFRCTYTHAYRTIVSVSTEICRLGGGRGLRRAIDRISTNTIIKPFARHNGSQFFYHRRQSTLTLRIATTYRLHVAGEA